MAKNSKDAYGAVGTTSLLSFDPSTLTIVKEKGHPLFDERALMEPPESMILNVMAHGILQPITVRKNPETSATEVVTGRQRVKALIEANKRLAERGEPVKFIPARVTKAEDRQLAAMVVIENEIRHDDTPINRANKMQRLRDEFGFGDDQIAVVFGCTMPTVRAMSALLECTAVVRNAVQAGKVPLTLALTLGKLPADEQRKQLEKVIKAGDGKKGHAKSKAQRKAAGKKSTVRGAKEIAAMTEHVKAGGDVWKVLMWVLGSDDESFKGQ